MGYAVVLGYFVFIFYSLDGFQLFFLHLSAPLNTESLDTRGVAADNLTKKVKM